MSSSVSPKPTHEHRFWLMPDSALGRWAGGVFLAALALPIFRTRITRLLERVTGLSSNDTPFVTPTVYSLGLAGVAAVLAIIALIRGDRAVVLLVPALFGVLGIVFMLGEILSSH